MFKRILTVCVGNICRSPMAEYIFRYHLKGCGIEVESAGLGALIGQPMEETARELLCEHGITACLGAHKGRQLTPHMLRSADLILAMERHHVSMISKETPEISGKLFLLDKWADAHDIPDPYRQQRPAFEHVYNLIDRGVQSWLPYL